MRAVAVLLTSGCVSKGAYAELESQYDAAMAERDAAQADRDVARNDLQGFQRGERARLEEFDRVSAELREIEAADLARAEFDDGRALLALDADTLFASGTADLSPEGLSTVQRLAAALADGTNARFQVRGPLGSDRAMRVVSEMIAAGFPADRISAALFGDPRRIEVVWVPGGA